MSISTWVDTSSEWAETQTQWQPNDITVLEDASLYLSVAGMTYEDFFLSLDTYGISYSTFQLYLNAAKMSIEHMLVELSVISSTGLEDFSMILSAIDGYANSDFSLWLSVVRKIPSANPYGFIRLSSVMRTI